MIFPPLLLASASPRRLELLRRIGLDPGVIPSDVVESAHPEEPPADMVRRLAEAKVRSVLPRVPAPALVLGADTAVVIDGDKLGKPRSEAEAVSMLERLSGRTHSVWTGVFLLRTDDRRSVGGAEETLVGFRELDATTIRRYARTGEPLDKAGAYGIQDRGALLVRDCRGSWSNVVGLPLERLPGWLEAVGIELADWIGEP